MYDFSYKELIISIEMEFYPYFLKKKIGISPAIGLEDTWAYTLVGYS
jgi:hypothetical protein